MKTFKTQSKLQKAVFNYLASNISSNRNI